MKVFFIYFLPYAYFYFILQKGMPHQFAYDVVDDYSGNNYGHEEESDGNVVTGEYFVQLPDGRLQIVTYTADHENGYQAQVRYEGEAEFPHPSEYQSYEPPKPSYKPRPKPRPTYKPRPKPSRYPQHEQPSYGEPEIPVYEQPQSLYGPPSY